MKTATLIKDVSEEFNGRACLYKVEPPARPYNEEKEARFDYVIASTASCLGRVETYLFGADENGTVQDWAELPGSMKDTESHEEVLLEAGYILQP